MAIGLPPKHVEELSLDDLSASQFLGGALQTIEKLGWETSQVSDSGLVAYTNMSLASWGEQISIEVNNDSAILESRCTGTQLIDWGRNHENTNQFIDILNEILRSTTLEALSSKFEDARTSPPSNIDGNPHRQPLEAEMTRGFFSFFIPRDGFYVTPIIVDLNIAVFILMVISGSNILLPSNDSLLSWGANYRPLTLEAGGWRLLTSCFLHIGVFHLAMNMYALLYVGQLLEPLLGKLKFAIAYLMTGVIASTVSLYWHETTISAGASGAIFGLYGIFVFLLSTSLVDKARRKALVASIGIFVVYNLMYGMNAGIDNAAHIGGLICGIFIGLIYYPSLKKPAEIYLRYSTLAFVLLGFLSISLFVYNHTSNDLGTYQRKIEEFAGMEASALRFFELPESTPKDKLLVEIKRGIPLWNAAITLLMMADTLQLPQQLHDRNKDLIQYCALRRSSYELIYKSIDEDSHQYDTLIDSYSMAIAKIVDNLSKQNIRK